MENSVIANIRNLLGISGDVALGDLAPIIGDALQSLKIRKLKKRLDSCEKKVEIISTKVSTIDDEKFVTLVKEFLFPSILQYLLDEEEDKKTSYFLDGFEFVVDKKLINDSKILIYYDILRGLRFMEIEYLASLSYEYKLYRRKVIDSGGSRENPFNDDEISLMKDSIESKLEGLGLIKTGKSDTAVDAINLLSRELNRPSYIRSSTLRNKEVSISSFGISFLNMFNILDKYK